MNILLVEDNLQVSQTISQIVTSLNHQVIAVTKSYEDAVETLQQLNIDIVLLDIDLKGKKTGIDVAIWLKENTSIPFIFISGNFNEEIIEKASYTSPITYLVKPISKNNLKAALILGKQKNDLLTPPAGLAINAFFLKVGEILEKIEYDKILFVKSDHVYLEINLTNSKKILFRGRLDEFKELYLNNPLYLRTHQRFVVNVKHVESLEKHTLLLSDNSFIPISKSYLREVKKALQNF